MAEETKAPEVDTVDTNEGEQKLASFDDMLKDKAMQAEFDRRVNKAIETAKSKWDSKKDEDISEAEKLAKMTKAEKAEYELNKRVSALEAREKEIARKELLAQAKTTLAEKKIPDELSSLVDLTDADACSKSIEAIEKAFSSAVEEAVKSRLGNKEGMKETRNKGKQTDPQEAEIRRLIMGR